MNSPSRPAPAEVTLVQALFTADACPAPVRMDCTAAEVLACLLAALAPHPFLALLRQADAFGVRRGPLPPDELRAADVVLAQAERKARGDWKERIRSARGRLARLLATHAEAGPGRREPPAV